jgi:hypothetical protein
MIAEIIHKIAQETRPGESTYHPRPSSCSPMFEGMPGRCIRQMVYHRLSAPSKPLAGRTIMIFDDGNMHEDATAKWIFKSGIVLSNIQMGVDVPLPKDVVIPCQPSPPPDRPRDPARAHRRLGHDRRRPTLPL